MHDRQNESSSSARVDQSSPMIVVVIRTRRNESRCSNRAGTLGQLREVKERRVGRACTRCGMGLQPVKNITEERRDVLILPPVTNEPCCGTEQRLESVQEARRRSGEQAVAAVHPISGKSGDSRFRSPKRQRLDAAPDETEVAKATAYRPRNMTPHGQVRLQQDPEIAHRCRGLYQGPTYTQLTGVKMDIPCAGCAPQEVRLLGVEPQSAGTHPFGDPLNTKLHTTTLLYNCRWMAPRIKL